MNVAHVCNIAPHPSHRAPLPASAPSRSSTWHAHPAHHHPPAAVEARLHKLLLYEPGAFFKAGTSASA